MKVLVTGATGFIGRHLCRHLAARGHRLRVLVRPTTSASRLERLGEVETVTGDVTVPASLPEAVDGCEAVVHLAGVIAAARRAIYERVNVDGTRNLALACRGRGVSRIVYVSSLAAQGPSVPGQPHRHAGDEAPVNDYGHSKLAAERCLLDATAQVPAVVLRPGIVFGPYDPEIAAWARMARLRVLPIVAGLELSFVHVDDLCVLIGDLLEPGERPAGPFFVSDDPPVSMELLADLIERAAGSGPALRMPLSTSILTRLAPSIEKLSSAVGAGPLLARTLRELAGGGWACVSDDARAELGFVPSRPFVPSFVETLDWYRREGWL
ncbi:MAG: NAD-dependent epimerase/dehydratase family protein [bacterium]